MAETKEIEIREQDKDLLFSKGMLRAMTNEILSYYGTMFVDDERRRITVESFVDRMHFIQTMQVDAAARRYDQTMPDLPEGNDGRFNRRPTSPDTQNTRQQK